MDADLLASFDRDVPDAEPELDQTVDSDADNSTDDPDHALDGTFDISTRNVQTEPEPHEE